MRPAFLLLLAAMMPGQAAAANYVALDNHVFVERVTTDAAGKPRVLLEEPKVVVPGDRLVFVLNYRNAGAQPADKFVVTNPMPAAVRFADAGDAQPFVSVDGGNINAQTREGPLTVVVAPDTKITETSGIAKRKGRDAKSLLPGLIFTVEGDQQGSTVSAKEITFKERDWRSAVATKAGTKQELGELRKAIIEGLTASTTKVVPFR